MASDYPGDEDGMETSNASWTNCEGDDASAQELESLDPQKRELLEARFLGPTYISSPESNQSASIPVPVDPDIDRVSNSSAKKRLRSDGDSKQGHAHGGKQPRVDACRKISEFFKQQVPPTKSASSPSSRPGSGSSGKSRGVEPIRGVEPAREVRVKSMRSVEVQTTLTTSDLEELEGKASSSHLTDSLQQRVSELEHKLEMLQDKNGILEQRLEKCRNSNKKFLLEKAVADNKRSREESVEKQLRLGRFTTSRRGAQFVEVWVEGFAFSDVTARQDQVAAQREELEKQKKQIGKRKGPLSSPREQLEKEELLKMRAAFLKKEDLTLSVELEKLERERNLHVRELKRLSAEDSSRFKDHPTLHDRYLLLHLIGKGGFSEVYKGFDMQDQCFVACKIHQLNSEWKEDKKANYVKHALREYNIHKKLDHVNIVKLFDVFEIDSNSFCTVLEYVEGHDLDFLLKQSKTLPEKEVRVIIVQCVSALKYLNEIKPPIIHFDLKPGNILLGSGMKCFEAKLTDFGLSKVMEQESPDGMDLTSQGAGTYWYLPPECFVVGKAPPKISSKVDVWSLGIIFFQCLYGKKPFGNNLSQASILEQNTILNALEVEFPAKPQVSAEAKTFMKRCLTYQKELRPDVLSLCSDPYILPKRLLPAPNTSSNGSTVT